MPVDRDVVDDLEPLRKVSVGRADHRDQPAGAAEGLSLLPDPPIERDRQIFDDDDTGPGLTRRRHERLSIAEFAGSVKDAALLRSRHRARRWASALAAEPPADADVTKSERLHRLYRIDVAQIDDDRRGQAALTRARSRARNSSHSVTMTAASAPWRQA